MKLKYKLNNKWEEIPNFKVIASDLPNYDGKFEVVPLIYDEQVLPTKNTKLDDNITVKKIPQLEVSNLSDGYTLIIGEESLNG